jgi:hypothetical protein
MVSELKSKYPTAEEIIREINKTEDIYLFSSQGLKDQEITIFEMMPKLNNIKVAAGIG